MEAWEGHHVDLQLVEVSIELSREAKAGGDTAHGGLEKVAQVPIGWHGHLEGAEAGVIKGFIINAVGIISILYQLMDRLGGCVELNHSVRHFGWRYHTEGVDDEVRIFFTNLTDEHGAHSRACAPT